MAHSGGLAVRHRAVRLLLPPYLRKNDLDLRLDAPQQAGDLAVRTVPPDWFYIRALGQPIWDTLNMATLGTAVATAVLAIPGRLSRRARHDTERECCFMYRAVHHRPHLVRLTHDMGADAGHHHRPGVFAGIIAIALRSIGFCAKLLYEAIEEIDEGQVEARATGASGAQVTTYGITLQVLPAFAGISVFRWDI